MHTNRSYYVSEDEKKFSICFDNDRAGTWSALPSQRYRHKILQDDIRLGDTSTGLHVLCKIYDQGTMAISLHNTCLVGSHNIILAIIAYNSRPFVTHLTKWIGINKLRKRMVVGLMLMVFVKMDNLRKGRTCN